MDELSEKDFVVIDDFMNAETYTSIRTFFLNHLPHFKKAGIGALDENVIRHDIRGDHTYWLDRVRDQELNHFWTIVDEVIQLFNRYCFLSLSGYEFHLANYPPESHYERHLDQFNKRNNRTITIVYYFNEGWTKGDGGELEMFIPDINGDEQSVVIEPLAGRLVMFKSAVVPHCVRPSNINRYSLTGWLLQQPSALGYLLG